MKLKVKFTDKARYSSNQPADILTPSKAYSYDAGLDLRYSGYETIEVRGGALPVAIPTGIMVEIPNGYYGHIVDRSGNAKNKGFHVVGGIVDSAYRGEILVLLTQTSGGYFHIAPGDKIAQMLILPVPEVEIEVVDELSPSERGEKGFGSSDIKK